MIEVMQVDAWVCSWCGWRWLKVGEVRPVRCPSRKCRKLASSGESGSEKLNRIENKPRSPKPATRITTQKAAAKAKTTVSQPVEVQRVTEKKLGRCPSCGAQLQPWGAMKRCQKCQRNY